MWTLDHLDDLASDFSAIHRIDDITALDGPRFFRLAYRIGCYQGVMRDLVAAETRQAQAEPSAAGPAAVAAPPPVSLPPGSELIGASKTELQLTPAFAGIFSFGGG